jgi:hypothetical protein
LHKFDEDVVDGLLKTLSTLRPVRMDQSDALRVKGLNDLAIDLLSRGGGAYGWVRNSAKRELNLETNQKCNEQEAGT